MDLHRQFTFDDPEDSYWNDGTETGGALFDTSRTAVVVKQALDDLFETRVNSDSMSTTTESEDPTNSEFEIYSPAAHNFPSKNFTTRRPSASGAKAEEQRGASESRLESASFERPYRLGSVSVLSDCSVGSFATESTSNLDYGKLKTEFRQLQRDYRRAQDDRFAPLTIRDAICRLRSRKNVSLDFYKSKQQKLELLDAAIESARDDIILMIVLFLKRTVISSIFREIMILRPEAANVYVSYLKADKNYPELIDTLFALGRIDEASMVELALALQKKQPGQKVSALRKCIQSGLSSPALQTEAIFAQEKIKLLERQILIESTEKEAPNDFFIQFPKKSSLIDQSLLTTVYYTALYHYSTQPNVYTSPQSFKQEFNLSEKEYCWMVLSALSKRQDYAEIEKLLTPKKIFAMQKLVCPFPWPAFFSLVSKFGSPPVEVLAQWLKSVPDAEERFRIADQFGDRARDVQFDALISLKDKRKLIGLMSKLTPNSANYLKAQAILATTAQKWKD